MKLGSTPKIIIETDVKLGDYERLILTVKQANKIINKEKDSMTESAEGLEVRLNQDDTLQLSQGYAYLQLKGKNNDGFVELSDIVRLNIEAALNKENI